MVEVNRAGNLLEVIGDEAYIEALAGQLVYFKQVPTVGYKRRESKFEYVKTILYSQPCPTKLIIPAGFTTRSYDLCNVMGLDYKFTDLRPIKMPEPDFTRLAGVTFRDGQEEQLVTICSSDHGVIKAPTGFGKSELIGWLCQIYPTAIIVVCAQSREIVKSLYKRIDNVALDVGIVGAGYNHPDRITITTARSLNKAPLDKANLLLFDECHTAAAEETKIKLASVRDARRFGFSASPIGRHDKADLETEAMFGPVICDIEYQEAVESGAVADIQVLMLAIDGSPIPYTELIAKERHGLWRNEVRNKAIAEATKMFSEDDQLLIMVSKIEHGLALKKLLPDWEFIYGNVDSDQLDSFKQAGLVGDEFSEITTKKRDEFRNKFESGELKRAIATSVWNTGVDFQRLLCLIRADGGVGEIGNTQIPGRLSRVQYKTKGYLIDCYDKFDPTLLNRSLKRIKSYSEKGWEVKRVSSVAELRKFYDSDRGRT
jgi:superfamily II DNA or RNA helicase